MPNILGKQAEELAQLFLIRNGFKLLYKNFFCRLGEVDLIMRNASTLLFVEVKMRSSTQFGLAHEAVTQKKQQKLFQTSQYFLQKNPELQHLPCRFDVIAFHHLKETPIWIQNAFQINY